LIIETAIETKSTVLIIDRKLSLAIDEMCIADYAFIG
jgi:hypothetical protein